MFRLTIPAELVYCIFVLVLVVQQILEIVKKNRGVTMWLRVDPYSTIPMYQQIIDGIKAAIAKGQLLPGDKLLTVRDLAAELAINHNTVAKAYQELERDRVIQLIRGRGTFVAMDAPIQNGAERRAEIRAMMLKLIVEAHHARMPRDELLRLFQSVLAEWNHNLEVNPDESTGD